MCFNLLLKHILVRLICLFQNNITLRKLDLSWNGFGCLGAVEIANALKSCALTSLDLSCNRIGKEGFAALTKAMNGEEELKILRVCLLKYLN